MKKKKEDDEGPEIKFIEGIPCIVLHPGSLIEKKSRRQNSVNHPFTFGWMQETNKKQFMPDIMKEIEDIFRTPFMPVKWKVFKITEQGEIKEVKEEDEENDNRK